MKTCCECKRKLSYDLFNKSSSNKDGLQTWCRECQKKKYDVYRRAHPEKQKARWKRYYLKNRGRMIKRTRDYEKKLSREEYVERYKRYNQESRLHRYGLDSEKYSKLLESQQQKCGMCSQLLNTDKPSSIHIDHNHETGKVRGILCNGCNLFLGRYESKRYDKKVSQAQTYLRKTEK